MTPYWIQTTNSRRLAIVPRPRGGDWLADELSAIRAAGIDVLVSMLKPEEQSELGLEEEAKLCEQIGLKFLSYPVSDRETPQSLAGFRMFIEELRLLLAEGKAIATHCRASIGRASVVLACVLADEGESVAQVFERLSRARGMNVPDTAEQVRFVERFASE
jgi:protein-tyrosine phosphatase